MEEDGVRTCDCWSSGCRTIAAVERTISDDVIIVHVIQMLLFNLKLQSVIKQA